MCAERTVGQLHNRRRVPLNTLMLALSSQRHSGANWEGGPTPDHRGLEADVTRFAIT